MARDTRTPLDVKSGARRAPAQAATYNPRSASIMQGQLRQIARYGTPLDVGKARKIAEGDGEPIWKRGLDVASLVLGAPVRAVEATLAPVLLPGVKDTKTYWSKLTDPGYGAGYEINRMFPHTNTWAKVGGGLAADVALDPLTYLSFGASPLLKAAGRGKGIAMVLRDAADVAETAEEAARLTDMATRAAKNATKLTKAELTEAARLSGQADNAYSIGVHFGFPHGGTPVTLSDKGVAGTLGRKLEEVGPAITERLGKTKVGEALGGNLNKVRQWTRSEDPGLVRKGLRILAGESRAKKLEAYAVRQMREVSAPLEAEARKLGITGEEMTAAMRERPLAAREPVMGASVEGGAEAVPGPGAVIRVPHADGFERRVYAADQGGPAWQALAADPEKHDVMSRWADEIANRREWAHATAAHGDVKTDFIQDAEAGGRPYVPRVPSEQMAQDLGWRAKSGNNPAKEAWMEQGAIAPGTAGGEKFMKEHGVELYTPGTVNEAFPEGAPAIEDQIETVLKAKHGEDYVPLWEPDFYKSNRVYERGLAKAVGKHHLSNYLTAKGIVREMPEAMARGGVQAGAMADLLTATGKPQWREDLFKGWEQGQMVTTAGKPVKNPAYEALNLHIARNEETLGPINTQFEMAVDDYDEAESLAKVAKAELDMLPRNPSGSLYRGTKEAKRVAEEKLEAYNAAAEAAAKRNELASGLEQQVAQLEHKRQMLQGAMADWRSADWNTILTNHKDIATAMHRTLNAGWEGFGFARQAPKDVVEVLADINRSYDPITGEGLQTYLKHYDDLLHWTKGWLTTSPGFIMRNIFGGMFNNWLAGANIVKSGREWGRILHGSSALKAGVNATKLAPGDRVLYELADRLGIIGAGQFSAELGSELGHVSYINPMAGAFGGEKSFALPYISKRLNEQAVEPYLRGTLYHDRIVRAIEAGRFKALGVGDMDALGRLQHGEVEAVVKAMHDSPVADEILADIDKYHFNYDDLSRTERQGVKRIIPFYTWTRKNVPLQVEAMFTQPGKAINRYMALKRNIELGSPPEEIVPSWMKQQGFIRMPWSTPGGRAYATVDLPFKDPFKIMDVTGQLEGMVNPLIKTPMELRNKRKFFNDVPLTGEYKPMPGSWAKFPGLVQALQLAEHAPFIPLSAPKQDAEGNWMMRDSDTYMLDQFLPWMYQAQRLAPFWDAKDNGRVSKESARYTTSIISYLAGIAARTNTEQDQESEIYRRIDALDPQVSDLKALGTIPTRPKRPTRRANLENVLATVGPAAEQRAYGR